MSVQEPTGDASSLGISDHVSDLLGLLLGKFTCTHAWVDPENLADEVAEAPTDALDGFDGVGHSADALDVGIENTQNVLEVVDVFNDERHDW